jgi:hypothetical protein
MSQSQSSSPLRSSESSGTRQPTRLDDAALQRLLGEVDDAAVLVSSRILERVVREDCGLPNMYWNIPHGKSYVCDRHMLFRHAEQADLILQADKVLPDTVILLARPDAEELSNLERKRLLLRYWRRLFHSRVHLALTHPANGKPLDMEDVRQRIDELGQTEFEEIRAVLIADGYLAESADDLQTYIEFAAVYLELRQFAASVLQATFPGIGDFRRIDKLLARDVNASELARATRLPGADLPAPPTDAASDESQEEYWNLVRAAEMASRKDNVVRAAILRIRASRVAPAAFTMSARQEAEADIALLCQRLAVALSLDDDQRQQWIRSLILLLDKADQGIRPTEARLLYDLQQVCKSSEEEYYSLDLLDYLASFGKRPIKRPVLSQRLVRVVLNLRSAVDRLSEIRLSDSDRDQLGRLLQSALRRSEDALRSRFRPVLETSLEDIGLRPTHPVEVVAFEKVIVELLDQISHAGYLTFGQLRDTLSRNQLKFPDLTDPDQFFRGDPLIRLDRRLAALLDGIYRPSEFYTRYLERGTSLLFGTSLGRVLVLYVFLPFGLAWLALHLLGMLLLKSLHWTVGYEAVPWLTAVAEAIEGPVQHPEEYAPPGIPHHLPIHLGIFFAAGLFTLGLLHFSTFRHRCWRALYSVWLGLRWVFFEVPIKFVPLEDIKKALRSWPVQLTYWYVFKPVLLAGLLWISSPTIRRLGINGMTLCYLLSLVVVNSRLGRAASEALLDGLARLWQKIRAGLLMGLLRFTIQIFKQVVMVIDYILIRVDEWLRFRSDDGAFSFVLRTVAGLLWAPVAFLSRFYMVVLIEPMINPVKMPIAFAAGKVMAPMLIALAAALSEALEGLLGKPLARGFAGFHAFLLPDAVAFLVWEMKENWSLFKANRGKTVRPVAITSHGDTVRSLLQPGFHSGRLPELYVRYRQAERRGLSLRSWARARALRRELEQLNEELRDFLHHDVLALLRQSQAWQSSGLEVGTVRLATNRIRLEILHHDYPTNPIWLDVEYQRGHLLATLRDLGWLPHVTTPQRRVFAACLAYFYKCADVDLVREQVALALHAPVRSLQPLAEELLVWRHDQEQPQRIPLLGRGDPAREDQSRVFFSATPLYWHEWFQAWQADASGEPLPSWPSLADSVLGSSFLESQPTRSEDQLSTLDLFPEHLTSNQPASRVTHHEQKTPELRSAAESQADRTGEEAACP